MIHFYRYIFRKRFSEMMFLSFSRCQRLLKNRQKLCLYSYSLIAIRTGLFVIFCIRMYIYPNIFPKNSGISEKNLHNLVMRISSLIANFKANQIKRSLRCHVFTIVQQWALRLIGAVDATFLRFSLVFVQDAKIDAENYIEWIICYYYYCLPRIIHYIKF